MIPVPRGSVVQSYEDACAVLADLGTVVVKPRDGNQGRGVTVGVNDASAMQRAFDAAREISNSVIVEEQFLGKDFRILFINGALAAASLRLPARVKGDGEKSVADLVEAVNRDPSRGDGHSKPLTRLVLDETALACLEEQGMTPECVPAAGRDILLRRTGNLSTGGEAVDVTSEVHPETIALCSRAARAVGLDICGIDLITPDISQPLPDASAGIIEVNAAPGIRMHEHPSRGSARETGEAIVDMLYPPGTSARIPIIAITGTNGKTTTTRMIERVIAGSGRVTGMTTTDGIFVGGRRIVKGDTTGFCSSRTVLADPAVEVAVLEVARGGLIRQGLAFDECDVAVLTNIQSDHIGQDGIESMEDLFHIKSLVAECVRQNGTVVLNADDSSLASLPDHPRMKRKDRRIVYFSLSEDNPVSRAHLAKSGTAYFIRSGWVIEASANTERPIMRENLLPATLHGQARFQVANAMAAIAACRAYGLDIRAIARLLSRFENDLHNPGRLNAFRVPNGHVLVDYGHNPAAVQAIASLAARWRSGRKVGCVLTLPGDRLDSLSEEAARIAARGFDRIVIKEDADLRGRREGELAERLHAAIREENPSIDCKIVLGGKEPFTYALETMSQDEIMVFFHDEIAHPLAVLRSCGAVPCSLIGATRLPTIERVLQIANG